MVFWQVFSRVMVMFPLKFENIPVAVGFHCEEVNGQVSLISILSMGDLYFLSV